MTGIIQILLFIYGSIQILALVYSVDVCKRGIWTNDEEKQNDYMLFCFPKQLYKNSNMNMFGCIMCFILFVIFDTIYVAMCLITIIMYSITYFVYYIFHVGRQDNIDD